MKTVSLFYHVAGSLLLASGCITIVTPPSPPPAPEHETGAVRPLDGNAGDSRFYPIDHPGEKEEDGSDWVWPEPDDGPTLRPARPAETAQQRRRKAAGTTGRLSLSLWSCRINGSLRYHRDYLDDYDRASLGRSFGLDFGGFLGISVSIEPARGPSFRGSLLVGGFESGSGFKGDPYTWRGEDKPGEEGVVELDMAIGSIALDFPTASWPGGDFHLGVGLTWIDATLRAEGVQEHIGSVALRGSADLVWYLKRSGLVFETGVELGLGLNVGLAGFRSALAWRPWENVTVRLGWRSFAAFIDDVCVDSRSDEMDGDELLFSLNGLFAEFGVICF